jgi:trigger factor
MDVVISEQSVLSKQVDVTVPGESVKKEVNRRLGEIAQTAKIKGFRPGKVPVTEIRRRYGANARMESVEKLIRSAIGTIAAREDLKGTIHFSRPELIEAERADEGFVFRVFAERMPEVEPVAYEGVTVAQPKAEVSDAEITTYLTGLQAEHTEFVPVEDRTTIDADDVLVVSYRTLGNGPEKGLNAKDQQVDLADSNLFAGVREGLAGKSLGDSVQVQVTLPPGFPIPALQNQLVTLEITASGIKRKDVPALDDSLAASTGEATTLDELKAKFVEKTLAERNKRARGEARDRLLAEVVKANEVTLPEHYLDYLCENEVAQRLQNLRRQGVDINQFAGQFDALKGSVRPSVERAIRDSLILQSIAKKESITVSDDDIEAHLAKLAEEQGQPLPKIKARYNTAEARSSLRMQVLFDRVLDFIETRATFVEGEPAAETETSG